MPINAPHQRYLDVLFAAAGTDRYPSHHVLERIEAAIVDRDSAERYVDLLLDEAEQQRYPSLRMLDRAGRVTALMALADHVRRLREEQEDED